MANNFSKMLSGVVSQAKTFEMEAASFAVLHTVSFAEFLSNFIVNYITMKTLLIFYQKLYVNIKCMLNSTYTHFMFLDLYFDSFYQNWSFLTKKEGFSNPLQMQN